MKISLNHKLVLTSLFILVGFISASDAKADYYKEGVLQSKAMLLGAAVDSIDNFQVVANIPASTTLSVQFSTDQINYYNASNTIWGWDICTNGTTTVDLSSLNWEDVYVYYKLKLTTTNISATPVVYDVKINYEGSEVPAGQHPDNNYHRQGALKSENIFYGTSVTAINDIEIDAYVPAGTSVGIKFSQDGLNFYNSSGVKEGVDACSNGITNIDISGLGWSQGFSHYKIMIGSNYEDITPVVRQVTIDYDGSYVQDTDGDNDTYYREGTLVSKDLLGGTPLGSDIYFGYSIGTLPVGTSIEIQFSQNATSWYSSTGTAWAWNNLVFGEHYTNDSAIDLSALGWESATSLYYKLRLKSTLAVDNDITPTLNSVGLFKTNSTMGTGTSTPLGTPILELNFDEGKGAIAYDSSGNGNNGTLVPGAGGTNSTTTAMWDKNGKVGGALEFDGTDDYVLTDTTSTSSALTWSVWIKPDQVATDQMFIGPTTGVDSGFYFRINGSKPFISVRMTNNSQRTLTGAENLVNGNWYHLLGMYDGVRLKLYVNGILSANGSVLNETLKSWGIGRIGRWTDADQRPFKGLIDEVNIYNYALSEDEIKTLYNGSSVMAMGGGATANNNGTMVSGDVAKYCVPGDNVRCDKPVLELRTNEKTSTIAYDNSGYGNNGSITGAIWGRGKVSGGLNFDGVNDYARIIATPVLENLRAMTVDMWLKPRSDGPNSTSNILYKGGDSGIGFWMAYITDSDQLYFQVDGTTDLRAFTNEKFWDYNEWQKVSLTWDGSNNYSGVRFFKNGSATTTAGGVNGTSLRSDSGNDLLLSRGDISAYWYDGLMDELKIYNYARTPAQIAWDYNGGKAINHWELDEGSGAVAHDEGASLINGAITEAAWKLESECKVGKCLYFDGINDYVGVSTAITGINAVSLWVKPTSTTQSIIDFDGGTHKISISSSAVTATGFTAYYVDGEQNGTVDTNWHHIMATTNTAFNSTSGYTIGRIGASYYSGKIDDVKIFNYIPTLEQIKMDHNGGAVNFR